MNKKTKSPLKARPLRNPGQSLDEEIQRILDDTLAPIFFIVAMLVFLAGFEWFRWYREAPYTPWVFTIAASIGVVYGILKILKLRRKVQRFKLGRDGEKAVGQYLERLREEGNKVFHDVIGERFNIDHVVIGSNGIFTIETKTYSKPKNGKAQIEFDGEKIKKNGVELDQNPVIQSKAQASWLAELLGASTGKRPIVRGVFVFPGWFVESNNHSDIWVLNPKGLKTFMGNCDSIYSEEDQNLFAYHLSRFIRTA